MELSEAVKIIKEEPSFLASRAAVAANAILAGIAERRQLRAGGGKHISDAEHERASERTVEKIKRDSTLHGASPDRLKERAASEYGRSVSSLDTDRKQEEGRAQRTSDRWLDGRGGKSSHQGSRWK